MGDYRPERDASLGLIFRLNALWEKADRRALSGDLNSWELVLDRIYSNLLYREELEITQDEEEEEILEIELSKKDKKIWKKIKAKISKAKEKIQKLINARTQKDPLDLQEAKAEHYHSIMLYDVYLRKFMQSLGQMYLRESTNNPSKAMWGGN